MRLYNDYNTYLRKRYGCRVYRIGLDAGFTCPNRDGTLGTKGCIYCNADGSRSPYTDAKESVKRQLESRMEYLRKNRSAKKFIAYFQAFTNTYASAQKLRAIYDNVRELEDIVGISIGTRCDSVDREKLELISSYKGKYEVWIEYGLQSIHDKTLKAINRGHDFKSFMSSFTMAKGYGLNVCVHVILGLPGETRPEMMETARKISDIGADGVKIHLLHILRGSPLERIYNEADVRLLEQDEYVRLVCDFLENLSPDIVIQRLTGEAGPETHVAPVWALDKTGTINKIKETLLKRGSSQGRPADLTGSGTISECRRLSQRSSV